MLWMTYSDCSTRTPSALQTLTVMRQRLPLQLLLLALQKHLH